MVQHDSQYLSYSNCVEVKHAQIVSALHHTKGDRHQRGRISTLRLDRTVIATHSKQRSGL
jgi:hypothetical protein